MHTVARFLLAVLFGALAVPFGAHAAPALQPVTILVSIDGFRADYLERGVTPVLSALAENGVSAAMRPSFPSKTFPNHWAIVTGATPDRSGIIANRMEDPRRPGEVFAMASTDPFWWNGAEPIWVTAERAGLRTATMFWPGSNVAWGEEPGERPRDWHQYNEAVSNRQRVDAVLDWLRRPAASRPAFVTLYFDTVDTAGHDYGPDDPRTTSALAEIDRTVASLIDGLRELGQPANLVIVSDHGMAATSPERVIVLDTLADPAGYRIIESGPFVSLEPQPGHEAAVAAALLRLHPHMECWRKAEIPARLRYGRHPRVASIFCLAEPGWLIESAAKAAEVRPGGNHGYDNNILDMAALFIASGPSFRSGVRLPPFDNVDVNPLLRRLLGLPQSPQIDGTDDSLREALVSP
jgi:predicted AlkP superfamily pyrophosphatase or phosphodiesterase